MVVTQYFQDAGQERRLEAGQTYQLSTVVATALIAVGVAVHVRETKPMAVPEHKRRTA